MTHSSIELPRKIHIAPSNIPNAGRGVFATSRILKGELIESCPTVPLHTPNERAQLRKTGLVNYYFLWGAARDRAAICLGWGSIYNHSFSPNSHYLKILHEDRMDFYALRDIEAGEEITVNYNGDPKNTSPLRIPGIPTEAGGSIPASISLRIAYAFLRRLRSAAKYIF